MDKMFLRYLGPAFRYAKSQNPALVRCRDDDLIDALALLKTTGVPVPHALIAAVALEQLAL